MAYDGEVMTFCPANLDLSVVYAVVVSGVLLNPCGHALLFVPYADGVASNDGYYFQVAVAYGLPLMMRTEGYSRYLSENKKTEIRRYAISISNPEGAYQRLVHLMGKKWVWGILPHNCAAFVEDIVKAGGSSAGLYSNCPTLEKFK